MRVSERARARVCVCWICVVFCLMQDRIFPRKCAAYSQNGDSWPCVAGVVWWWVWCVPPPFFFVFSCVEGLHLSNALCVGTPFFFG